MIFENVELIGNKKHIVFIYRPWNSHDTVVYGSFLRGDRARNNYRRETIDTNTFRATHNRPAINSGCVCTVEIRVSIVHSRAKGLNVSREIKRTRTVRISIS